VPAVTVPEDERSAVQAVDVCEPEDLSDTVQHGLIEAATQAVVVEMVDV
jgi:2-phospho-L-lactate guanylyltransferase (CobY/MobA/RfbA family)